MSADPSWEQAFNALDKRTFSAEACGGYDLSSFFERYCTKDSSILDFGCGKGRMVATLRERGYLHTFGADPSRILLGDSPHVGEVLRVMEGSRIPFESASFDFVYCSGVLHHIEWEALAFVLRELHRVLRPGGRFVFAEPRASLARSLGHVVLLSPLSKLSRNASLMADCLRAEWATYRVWLESERHGFLPLCREAGFASLETQRRLFTVVGALQRG